MLDAILSDSNTLLACYCKFVITNVRKEPFSFIHVLSSFQFFRTVLFLSRIPAHLGADMAVQANGAKNPSWSHDIPIVPSKLSKLRAVLTGGRTSTLATMKGLKTG